MRVPDLAIQPHRLTPLELQQLVGIDAKVVLEVGANDGADTVLLLNVFPSATIYAFEPDARAAANFKAKGHHPRVKFFEAALGAYDGQALFHVSTGQPPGVTAEQKARYAQGWDESGSLRAPKNVTSVWPWLKFEETKTVAVQRLDTWAQAQGVGKIDFIWADIQGAEGDLIAGVVDALLRTRYLYTEYNNDEQYEGQLNLHQLLSILPTFTVHTLYQTDVLLKNTWSPAAP